MWLSNFINAFSFCLLVKRKKRVRKVDKMVIKHKTKPIDTRRCLNVESTFFERLWASDGNLVLRNTRRYFDVGLTFFEYCGRQNNTVCAYKKLL